MSIKQAFRFIVVGLAATAVHYATAVAFASAEILNPRMANVAGFLCAFSVSFMGQWRWTFRDSGSRLGRALPAYFLVALSSFLLNVTLFELLLRLTMLPYYVSLALVLGAVTVITFLASRLWAFRPPTSTIPR